MMEEEGRGQSYETLQTKADAEPLGMEVMQCLGE